MDKLKKVLSMFLAFVLTFAIIIPGVVKAEEEVTTKVTLHKILMKSFDGFNHDTAKDDGDKAYDGNQIQNITKYFGDGSKEIADVYFSVKNKDGSKFIKKDGSETDNADDPEVLGGLTKVNGLELDTSKLKGEYQIVEIPEKSTYVGENGETLTGQKAVPVEITLPIYNKEGLVKEAHVYPKNLSDKPTTSKVETGKKEVTPNAEHAIGEVIPYTITTEVPSQTRWGTAFWADNMTEGLTYNDDVKIFYNDIELQSTEFNKVKTSNGFTVELTAQGLEKINKKADKAVITLQYTATLNEKAVVDVPESNDVTFHYGNDKVHGNTPVPTKPKNKEIVVEKKFAEGQFPDGTSVTITLYNAQTGEQVQQPVVLNKQKPTHTFTNLDDDIEYKVEETHIKGYTAEYTKEGENGKLVITNKKSNNPNPNNPKEPKIVTYGKKFVKTNDVTPETAERLKGAEFVVNDGNGNYLVNKTEQEKQQSKEAVKIARDAYLKAVKDKDGTETEKYQALEKAIKDSSNYKWVQAQDKKAATNLPNVVKLVSEEGGKFKIEGLRAGTYNLEEIKAPEGYALLAGNIQFQIGAGTSSQGEIGYDASNSNKDAQQVKNKKITIPQTGGIGTVIFTVAGIVIMAVAIVAMKKRKEN